MVSEDFKKIIDEDISKCEKELNSGNQNSRDRLHGTLVSKYGKIIDGFSDDLENLHYDYDGLYVVHNLETLKQKLILFKAMGYQNKYSNENNSGVVVNNTNQLNATFNISFEEVKRQVEDMTSLTESDIIEIHKKIDELEKIVNSSDRKTKKWDNARNIIKWIADKGVDVGIAMLPLLLQIG